MRRVTCHEFERLCNEQLDARDAASPELEAALDAHAALCPGCRAIAGRYRALRLAIAAWTNQPVPSEGLAGRVLAAQRRGLAHRWRAPATAAASLLVAALSLSLMLPGPRHDAATPPAEAPPPPVAKQRAVEGPPEPRFLASVVSGAVLELARETSAPAARVGRGVLVSATRAGDEAAEPPGAADDATDLLRAVGDELNQGVRPLSGSARQAFSFLVPSSMGG